MMVESTPKTHRGWRRRRRQHRRARRALTPRRTPPAWQSTSSCPSCLRCRASPWVPATARPWLHAHEPRLRVDRVLRDEGAIKSAAPRRRRKQGPKQRYGVCTLLQHSAHTSTASHLGSLMDPSKAARVRRKENDRKGQGRTRQRAGSDAACGRARRGPTVAASPRESSAAADAAHAADAGGAGHAGRRAGHARRAAGGDAADGGAVGVGGGGGVVVGSRGRVRGCAARRLQLEQS